MRFTPTSLAGAVLLEMEPHRDERGSFARLWCKREAAAAGISADLVQSNLSVNLRRGTLRGMHLQLPPSREGKLIRCLRGRICDVIIDLRPESRTFAQHLKVELSEGNGLALWVPPMFAHGFLTLEDDSHVLYEMSDFHAPELAFGVRWDDPAFDAKWPAVGELIMAARDAAYPAFDVEAWRVRFAPSGAGA